MGFVKTVKDILLKPFRTTHVHKINNNDYDGTERSSDDVSHVPPKIPRTSSRAAWRGRMKRQPSVLTPVPEEHVPADDASTNGKIKSPPAYIDNTSGLGLGDTGNTHHVKKTHILIDLRELMMAGECDSDSELDDAEDSTSPDRIKHFNVMPPNPYVKRQNKLLRSPAIHIDGGGFNPKIVPNHVPSSATELVFGKAVFEKKTTAGTSAMDVLDDIIQSEEKLDKPYLTKDNVDTSLPGSTALSQKAGTVQYDDVQYIPSTRNDYDTITDIRSVSCVSEKCTHDNSGVDSESSFPSRTHSQIQESCSSVDYGINAPWPMKKFRNNNVTDITIRGVSSDGIVVGRSDETQVTQNNHGIYPDQTSRDQFQTEQSNGGIELRKEVSFSSELSHSTPKSAGSRHERIPSAGNISKPILVNQQTPSKTEGHGLNAIDPQEQVNGNVQHGLVRSKSARNYQRVDIGRNLLLKDAIPRTSFFSCHEQSLREAGYNVKELERAARMVRIKQKKVGKPREDQSGSKPGSKKSDVRKVKSFMALTRSTKRRQRMNSTDSNDEYGGADVHVDPEPLLRYLHLILTNPLEYSAMKETAMSSASNKFHPPSGSDNAEVEHQQQSHQINDSLVDLNKAYQRCQENFSPPESMILQAVNEIGSKTWDSHPICIRYEAHKRARLLASKSKYHPLLNNRDNVTSLSNGGVSDTSSGTIVQEQPLTLMEKARGDVERWIKSLSMVQVIKAKEIALGVYGEEERSLRHWWNANKYCKYIRNTDSTVQVV